LTLVSTRTLTNNSDTCCAAMETRIPFSVWKNSSQYDSQKLMAKMNLSWWNHSAPILGQLMFLFDTARLEKTAGKMLLKGGYLLHMHECGWFTRSSSYVLRVKPPLQEKSKVTPVAPKKGNNCERITAAIYVLHRYHKHRAHAPCYIGGWPLPVSPSNKEGQGSQWPPLSLIWGTVASPTQPLASHLENGSAATAHARQRQTLLHNHSTIQPYLSSAIDLY
jgi:hypothetical protein